jgi:isopentenyldiphosphate isomerase
MKNYQLVDKNDKPQWGISGKAALHSLETMYHRSSHVFIEIFGGKFILQKKAALTENDGLWSSAVSGHVELGESYRDTAIREAKEELGLTIPEGELDSVFAISPIHYKETNREFVTLFTYLLDPSKERIYMNEEELDGVAIMPRKNLEKDIKNNNDRYSPVFVILFDIFTSLKRGNLHG